MQALSALDDYLSAQKLSIEIVICGAFAIHLYNLDRGIHTLDVDTIKKISSAKALAAIEEIGHRLGLGSRWLNDQASTVSIPKGAFERAKPINNWKVIRAKVLHRSDLIKMKASAFSIRREQTNKDWEDLILLKPTQKEIDSAIEFVKETNSPPVNASPGIINDFKETINDLKSIN